MSISWDEQLKLLPSDIVADDEFGYSVDIHNNYAIVGARLQNSGTSAEGGVAYIYKKNDNDEIWSEQSTLKASDAASFDYLGSSVSIYGDYAAVGAWGETSNTGAIYIFKKDENGDWSEQQKLTASDKAEQDQFGGTLSMYENYLVTTSVQNAFSSTVTYSGSAYIFKKDENSETWSEIAKLLPSDSQANNKFGNSISMYGDFIAVGWKWYNPGSVSYSGAVIIFKNDGNDNWSLTQKLRASDTVQWDQFSMGLDMEGDYIVIGAAAPYPAGKKGQAYIFKKDENGDWSEQQRIVPSDNADNDLFGASIAISSKYIFVSSPGDDDNSKSNSGSIYVFKKDDNSETWNQVEKITASDAAANDYLGWSNESWYTIPDSKGISMFGNYAIAASYKNDSKKGSAYIFKLTGDDNTPPDLAAAAAAKAALDASNNTFKSNFSNLGVSNDDFEVLKQITVSNSGIGSIQARNIKNTVTTNASGQPETKENIKKKQKELFNVLFANNSEEESIKFTATDIGLDKIITDALDETPLKENVLVLKKNQETAIVVSDNVSEDTGIYAELSELNDSIIFDIGTGKDVKVTKIQDASSVTGAVDKWDVSYNQIHTQEAGTRVHLDDVTIYIGSVYIDGNTSAIPSSGVMNLRDYRIIYDPSNNILLTTRASDSKIKEHRHNAIEKIWENNTGSDSFLAYSSQLGLDKTVGKPIKSIVKVHKAKNGQGADNTVVSDLTSTSEITKHQGSYAAIRDLYDYIIFKSPNGNNFRVQVTETIPNKGYMIRDTANSNNLSENTFRDGQWTTYDGVTLYFGGVYTSGTDDGVSYADPYVFPINGSPYKLPDKSTNYCLYADKNTFITGTVSKLSEENQEKMRQWVIEKVGSDTNNGAELVTDGYFYSKFHVNTNIGQLFLDMETKVCNTSNKDVFTVKFKNSRDNTNLFKGEHKTTATISWKDNTSTMAIDVDFFENPQIRNGIRINTAMTDTVPIGILVEDYEPELLEVTNDKNKLQLYKTLKTHLVSGKQVKGDKLNLQKNNELWSRHNI
tara:strand:+ start:331 stop:3429 length:3099 start_codon:yes stop_codon:yes gene_type:complete